MRDAWDDLRAMLGPRVGAEFLRRLASTHNGEVELHVGRSRGQTVRAWVAPPESIPLDAADPRGAESV